MVGVSSNIVAWPAHVALCKLSPASTLVCPSLLEKHQQNCGSELSWYPILLEELNWLPLTTRQKIQKIMQKVKVCYNIVEQQFTHTSHFFNPHPPPVSAIPNLFNTIKSSFSYTV